MADSAVGEIDPAKWYTLTELKRRLDWGNVSVAQARRRGLRLHYVGRSALVEGAELCRYIAENSKETR